MSNGGQDLRAAGDAFSFETRTLTLARLPCLGEQVEWTPTFAPYVAQVRHYRLGRKQDVPVG